MGTTCRADGTPRFKNDSDLKFVDISSEAVRTYEWPDGFKIVIENPEYLHVSKSGGHRIWDKSETSHYIQPGWRHLFWKVKEGQPNFVT